MKKLKVHRYARETAKEACRDLRRNQTPSEQLLWDFLRDRKFLGVKFLRQHPLFFLDHNGCERFYIADFYCDRYQLVIELDGAIHQTQKEYDANRTEVLRTMGLTVVRFTDDDVERNLNGVLQKLCARLTPKSL